MYLYKKKPIMENIPSVANATETAIATFFVDFEGCIAVAVGFAIPPLVANAGGWFSFCTGGGGAVGYSLKKGMSGDVGLSGGGGGGEVTGGGAELTGNNGWCRILLVWDSL